MLCFTPEAKITNVCDVMLIDDSVNDAYILLWVVSCFGIFVG